MTSDHTRCLWSLASSSDTGKLAGAPVNARTGQSLAGYLQTGASDHNVILTFLWIQSIRAT